MSEFACAGIVAHDGLNLLPAEPPPGRIRHQYGNGPFAKLVMNSNPAFRWDHDKWRLNYAPRQVAVALLAQSDGRLTPDDFNRQGVTPNQLRHLTRDDRTLMGPRILTAEGRGVTRTYSLLNCPTAAGWSDIRW